MSRSRVTSWPTYLLTGVPEKTRSRLTEDARAADTSTVEVVRQILCANHELRCDPVLYRYTSSRFTRDGNAPLLLRLQPKLMHALRNASTETGQPVRFLILDALEQHYAAIA